MDFDAVLEAVCDFVPVLLAVFDPVPLRVAVCVDDHELDTEAVGVVELLAVDVFVEVRVVVRVSAWCEEARASGDSRSRCGGGCGSMRAAGRQRLLLHQNSRVCDGVLLGVAVCVGVCEHVMPVPCAVFVHVVPLRVPPEGQEYETDALTVHTPVSLMVVGQDGHEYDVQQPRSPAVVLHQ